MDELAELLASLVDDPSMVTLVIPVDVTAAVRRREHNPGYHVNRGSGTVGGRTMARADGGFDVIVWGDPLGAIDTAGRVKLTPAGQPAVNREGVKLLRHTIAHEAQHVAMEAGGSGFESYGFEKISGAANRLQYMIARKMCDEHRAEYNAIQVTDRNPPSVGDIVDILSRLGEELDTAARRFHSSARAPINLAQLKDDVYTACAPYWTAVAYWAASYRLDDDIGDVPQDVRRLEIWQRYVGETWQSMATSLAQLPVADIASTSPDALRAAAKEVADAVVKSLHYIGFRHFDTLLGEEHFYIDRADFPSTSR